jgi:hypothetical protein
MNVLIANSVYMKPFVIEDYSKNVAEKNIEV